MLRFVVRTSFACMGAEAMTTNYVPPGYRSVRVLLGPAGVRAREAQSVETVVVEERLSTPRETVRRWNRISSSIGVKKNECFSFAPRTCCRALSLANDERETRVTCCRDTRYRETRRARVCVHTFGVPRCFFFFFFPTIIIQVD